MVAGESITFRKSLKLWDKFTLQTRIVGHDEKNIFIQQKFICRGDLMATGLVRVRLLRKEGGSVTTQEIFKEINASFDNNKTDLSEEWRALET